MSFVREMQITLYLLLYVRITGVIVLDKGSHISLIKLELVCTVSFYHVFTPIINAPKPFIKYNTNSLESILVLCK